MKANFPKVLIVGNYFELSTGGGITMTNLFKNWDKKNIAVVSERIIDPHYAICNNYYQLGYAENKRRFPFFLWQKKDISGKLIPEIIDKIQLPKMSIPVNKKMEVYNNFLHFSGLFHYSRKLKLSTQFEKWLYEFSPEVIYTQLSSLESINFVLYLHKKYKLPVIIHIMDDWPSIISKKGLLQSFWRKKIDKQFRKLLNKSKTLMSISDAMSEEYFLRYGKLFIPFHNPINVSYWIQYSKINYYFKETFVILYAGRIGAGLQKCFLDIVAAINDLVNKGLKIEFHLQSISQSYIVDEIKKFPFVYIKNPIPYEELPVLFSNADILLLPNDFDETSVSFLRYSMPTKASEYMATGTPILLYASPKTAVVKHAKKNGWAYLVTENEKGKLIDAINELYNNPILRAKLGNTAKEYAIKHFSDIEVCERFRQAFVLR